MSLFKVTTTDGKSVSVNPAHVVFVQEQDNGAVIVTIGGTLAVSNTYRSVRGYVSKGSKQSDASDE